MDIGLFYDCMIFSFSDVGLDVGFAAR